MVHSTRNYYPLSNPGQLARAQPRRGSGGGGWSNCWSGSGGGGGGGGRSSGRSGVGRIGAKLLLVPRAHLLDRTAAARSPGSRYGRLNVLWPLRADHSWNYPHRGALHYQSELSQAHHSWNYPLPSIFKTIFCLNIFPRDREWSKQSSQSTNTTTPSCSSGHTQRYIYIKT